MAWTMQGHPTGRPAEKSHWRPHIWEIKVIMMRIKVLNRSTATTVEAREMSWSSGP